MTAKASSADFFAQIDDRVAQVKSLNVDAINFPRLPAILKTTSATKLESLRLQIRRGNGWGRGAVTLFGGKPAPPALKNFHVAHLPIALAPLRLSGLRSLVLNNLPIASAEDLLRILMDSPALNVCSLNRLALSTTFTPSEHLQRQLRSESNIAGANPRAIRLLHLRHLTLRELPVSFTHYLLSNIQASTFLSFSVQGELHESPASELPTVNTSHLVPLRKDSMANAETIGVGLLGDRSWAVGVGKLDIEFSGVRVEPRHVEETLNWVYGHLGEHLKALPASLIVVESDVAPDLILWLGALLRVTNLQLLPDDYPRQPRRIVSLLSRPLASMSDQWALPDLELFDMTVIEEAGKWEIFEMVRARHSFIQAQESQGRNMSL